MRKNFMLISQKYLHVDQLVLIFGYKNKRAFLEAVRTKKLPLPMYKAESGRLVADREVVRRFFAWRRREGIMQLESTIARTLYLESELKKKRIATRKKLADGRKRMEAARKKREEKQKRLEEEQASKNA